MLQNEIPLEDTLAYLSAATEASVATIFNPSPMPSDPELKAFPWHKITWLIINEGEASDMYKAISGDSTQQATLPGISSTAYAHIPAYTTLLRLYSQIPKTNIVCTLGATGVLTLVPSLLGELPGLPEPIFLPAAKLKNSVVDTTGAGDCFAGYMVAGLMRLCEEGTNVLQREHVISVLKRCVQVRSTLSRSSKRLSRNVLEGRWYVRRKQGGHGEHPPRQRCRRISIFTFKVVKITQNGCTALSHYYGPLNGDGCLCAWVCSGL